MNGSRIPVFAITFGIAVTVLYTVFELMTWAAFSYFPASGRWALGTLPASKEEGPAMYWYGWTVSALAGGFVAAALATFLPQSLTRKISPNLLWIVAIVAIVALAYGLRSFFTR
ncbi:MAG: hypothetical protein ACRECO_22745 [Xanthobacteraceae bacterium]